MPLFSVEADDLRRRRLYLDEAYGGLRQRRLRQLEDDAEVDLSSLEGRFWSGSWLCHPQRAGHRLAALVLMCLFGFGSYFCFDNPGALQREIKEAMHVDTFQFANLYAWYSWPNVILPIIGGYLMDTVFGIRLGTVIFAGIICVGQFIFAAGGLFYNYYFMQVGRFVFGIGGESLAVAQNTYAVSWFKGKELNMVFGFQLSFARFGSTVNFMVVGPLYEWFAQTYPAPVAVGWTLMVCLSTCIMSFVSAALLGWMDKRAEVLLRKKEREAAAAAAAGKDPASDNTVCPKDIVNFPATFWLLCIVALAYYGAIFPFISLGQVFFIKKFSLTAKSANFITGLIYLISAPASPILGYLIDKTGRNLLYVYIAVSLTLIGHVLLAFTFINPYVPVVCMGLAYSLLASALWPICALIVPEQQLGTAYGFMQAIQNLGLALITMASGSIVDSHGYIWLEIFFIFWLAVGLVCTLAMWVIDYRGSGYLNMGVSARDNFEAAEKEREAREAEARRAREEYHEALRPRTDREVRMRYLYRIGAALPPHLGHSQPPQYRYGVSSSPAVVVAGSSSSALARDRIKEEGEEEEIQHHDINM